MFIHTHDENQLFVQTFGSDKNETIIFCNSLGTNFSMWEKQIQALSSRYHIIAYDTRGHGQSTSLHAPWSLQDLGKDVITLLNHFHIEQAIFCGISMGGITGQWLAIHYPNRFKKFIICNTAAKLGSQASWEERRDLVLAEGLDSIARTAGTRWFTSSFIDNNPECLNELTTRMLLGDPKGYSYCCEILAKADLRSEIASIQANVIVVAGEFDPVTTISDAEFIHHQIKQSKLVILPCSHISNIEQAEAFNQLFD